MTTSNTDHAMTDPDQAGAGADTGTETPPGTDTDTPAPARAPDTGDSAAASLTVADTASGANPAADATVAIDTTPGSATLSGSFSSLSNGVAAAGTDSADTGDAGAATFTVTDTASGTHPRVNGTVTLDTTPTSAILSGSLSSSSDSATAAGADPADTGDAGAATFTFTDMASGTHPKVSGTLTLGSTNGSATLSGLFSSSSGGSADPGTTTTDTGGLGTATFAFIDTASGTNPNASGTLAIATTPSSATVSASLSSSSNDPGTADVAATVSADATTPPAVGSGDTSLLNDLSSGVMGAAPGSATDPGGQGVPTQRPTGSGCRVAGLHDGHGAAAVTGAPNHQFST